MAPDINSLPSSPRAEHPRSAPSPQPTSTAASRRTSQIMGPPTGYTHQALRSPVMSNNEQMGVPLRHPRPLTAAELYLECEKEQEAVVNRLTRELTALRAQSASVASNTSHSSNSTSASLLPIDISDPNPTHQMTGATHPTPARRHRSSSSVSNRSIPTPSTSLSTTGSSITNTSTQVQAGSTTGAPVGGISQASADRAAAAGSSLSRQPSVTASGTSTPARQSLDIARHGGQTPGTLFTLPHRPSLSRDPSYASTAAQAGTPAPFPHPLPSPAQSPSQSVTSAMQHYADTTAYRTEMEIVKAENDTLRQRVRALERALRARRRDSSHSDSASARPDLSARVPSNRESTEGASRPLNVTSPTGVAAWAANDGGVGGVAGPRERSESQSTTASSRRGGPPATEDDVIRVGESAGSVGLGRGF
ncbi:hypothetical protein LTR36_000750 [Oleoguttula mirabilis]|uniref:Uncharacterized protein n=1 Tax=Oleoguttula mirabilis TaxID=1507867 RepID=A0AAV9JQW0_9PEZI|nr:hypothetical protein LTR36_000750 [Oleoguttula mirabilis]